MVHPWRGIDWIVSCSAVPIRMLHRSGALALALDRMVDHGANISPGATVKEWKMVMSLFVSWLCRRIDGRAISGSSCHTPRWLIRRWTVPVLLARSMELQKDRFALGCARMVSINVLLSVLVVVLDRGPGADGWAC